MHFFRREQGGEREHAWRDTGIKARYQKLSYAPEPPDDSFTYPSKLLGPSVSFFIRKGNPLQILGVVLSPDEDITYQSSGFSAMEPSLGAPPSLLRLSLSLSRHKYMIFKINPSFVLPRCLPARSLGCLSICLFIVPIWSRINFTPLFVPFAVGSERGVGQEVRS